MASRRLKLVVFAFAFALILAACGGEEAATDAEPDPPEAAEESDTADDSETDDAEQEEDASAEEELAWDGGSPRIVIHSGQGGGADLHFRTLGASMSELLDVPFEYENMQGASGEIALREAMRQPADCETIFTLTMHSIAFTNGLEEIVDFTDEFTIMGAFLSQPAQLTVAADSDWETAQDFFDDAQEQELTIGFTSPRSPYGLAVLQLNEAGYQVTNVPMSSSDLPAALLGGHIDAVLQTASGTAALGDEVRRLAAFQPAEVADRLGVDSVNELLGINTVDGASVRTLSVRRGCEEDYPERFAALQAAYEGALEHEDFVGTAEAQEFLEDVQWITPADAEQAYQDLEGLVRENREVFEDE